MSVKSISAQEFDQKFDDGEDISDYIDFESARKPNHGEEGVNVDLPLWMIKGLDLEAQRLGITRQLVIKNWLAEKLA